MVGNPSITGLWKSAIGLRNFQSAARSKLLYKVAALIRRRLTLKEKKCVSHFSAI